MIYAHAYSNVLTDILRSCPVSGRVHSVFATSANLQFGNRLVHVGISRHGELPYGILLGDQQMETVLDRITLGERVDWERDKQVLSFQAGLAISLTSGVPFSSVPRSHSICRERIRRNAAALIEVLAAEGSITGFGVSAEDAALCLFGLQQEPGEFCSLAAELKAAWPSSDPHLIEKVLRKVIGRGQGLTPSGDDLLLGCLIGAVVTGTKPDAFTDVLRSLLQAEGRRLTTDVSLEYLLHATEDRFGSRLRNLAHEVFAGEGTTLSRALRELLEIGHTSGTDTATGLLLWISLSTGDERIGETNRIGCTRGQRDSAAETGSNLPKSV